MRIRNMLSAICYLLVVILLVVFGLRYLLASQFMSYHAVALDTSWSELSEPYQTVFLGLIRVVGGGMLAGGAAIGFMLVVPFRRKEPWARWAMLITGLILSGSALHATLSIKFGTPASPPWIAALAGLVLTFVGFAVCPVRSGRGT